MSEYGWIDCGDGRQVYRKLTRDEPARSDLPSPRLHLDTMPPLWHPSNGKHYDSKSEFRRVTKMHGGTEVGNETQRQQLPGSDVSSADVGEAIRKVKEGYRPSVTEIAKDGWN